MQNAEYARVAALNFSGITLSFYQEKSGSASAYTHPRNIFCQWV